MGSCGAGHIAWAHVAQGILQGSCDIQGHMSKRSVEYKVILTARSVFMALSTSDFNVERELAVESGTDQGE